MLILGGTKIRRRSGPLWGPEGVTRIYTGQIASVHKPDLRWTQETESTGHPWPSGRGVQDVGGSFRTEKLTVRSAPQEILHVSSSLYRYSGPQFAAYSANPPIDWAGASSNSFLDAQGTTAIARSQPLRPETHYLTFARELLKDGLPRLTGSFFRKEGFNARSAGNEYLNLEFGLLPTLRDLTRLFETMNKADQILIQMSRDSGRVVRRRYTFPDDTVTTSWVVNAQLPLPTLVTPLYGASPHRPLHVQDTITRKRWFSGAFEYRIPNVYSRDLRTSAQGAASELNRLYGVRSLATTAWNVIPFSWAVDWFANVGDTIANLEAFSNDGLVMRYGYMMETTTHRRTYRIDDVAYASGQRRSYVQDFEKVTKVRRRASPFGFGLTWDGFSTRQLAIMAALGVTRGRS